MIAPGAALPLLWSPLTFDPGVLFWTWVVFAIVVFILAKAAWNPLINALEAREEKVKSGLEEAERARAEAKRIAADFEAKVKEAQSEAFRIAEEARAKADKAAAEMEQAARDRAEQLLVRAREEINLAQRQALEDLRSAAVELAITAAGAVIKKNVDDSTNRELASNVIQMVKQEETGS